jgi:hypothetical protein
MDGKFCYEVVLTVQTARFNQPVDDRIFTLTGMGMPEGTPVIDSSRPSQGPEMWDGSNIVPLRVHDSAGDLDAEGRNGEKPFRNLTSSVAVVLVALLALFVRRRQRRPGTRHRKTAAV